MPTPPNKPPDKLPLDKVFSPGGWLARHHPHYEFRPGQLEMAESVESALENRQHLIVEAIDLGRHALHVGREIE